MLDTLIGALKCVENFLEPFKEKNSSFSWKYEKIPTNPQIQKMGDFLNFTDVDEVGRYVAPYASDANIIGIYSKLMTWGTC